jgi:serine/threonine-protein kinase
MNDRLMIEPPSPRAINQAITPELEEIVYRALERDPRQRYSNAHEMQWDIENQEQVGSEPRGQSAQHRGADVPLAKRFNKRMLVYVALVLVPAALFGLMLMLAKR